MNQWKGRKKIKAGPPRRQRYGAESIHHDKTLEGFSGRSG
jgi:hypothetical protein